MIWRKKILQSCRKDVEIREKVRELLFRDPLFAFNAFFYTYDPRKRPFHQQPFCTYDYQDEVILDLVNAINEGTDCLLEKSRDMGASWMVILVFLWFWLNPSGGSDFLCGSRIEDYVDKKGDMRTLIEKARYALYRIPTWLRPRGFKRNIHDNFMRLQNPETGASITGESNNPNFSTGGRYAAVLFDEFAKWESSDEAAWTAAGDATPCRIPISTPFGAGGQYYFLVTDGKTRRITLHWTLHPDKSRNLYCEYPPPNYEDRLRPDYEPETKLRSPWYDKECERRTPTEIAQEIDIDYLGAGNPVFDGKSSQSLKYYRGLKAKPISWYDFISDSETGEPRDNEGHLVIYRHWEKGALYVVSSDVAEGKITGDYALIKVFNRDTKNVDATYYSHVDEVALAEVIKKVAQMYSDEAEAEFPWVAIECGLGPGLATFNKCVELEVPNLFMMPKYETTKQAVTYRKGWITSGSSKKVLVAGIKEFLVNREGYIDPRCVRELGTFVYTKTGKTEAKAGCHDDEVIALGIAIQVDEIAPYHKTRLPVKAPVREQITSLEDLKVVEEPQTLEEQCLIQALATQAARGRSRLQDFDEAIDLMYGDYD